MLELSFPALAARDDAAGRMRCPSFSVAFSCLSVLPLLTLTRKEGFVNMEKRGRASVSKITRQSYRVRGGAVPAA